MTVTVKDMLNTLNQLVQEDPSSINMKICLKGNGYPLDISVLQDIQVCNTQQWDRTHVLDCYIEEDSFIYLEL